MDQLIQRAYSLFLPSLFLNQISQTFYQINRLPMRRNHLLRSVGKGYKDSFSVKWSLSKTCKISFDTIPLSRWCNPLVYLSPMHYGNSDMQASRHGHVFIHACARVYAHTCLFACALRKHAYIILTPLNPTFI